MQFDQCNLDADVDIKSGSRKLTLTNYHVCEDTNLFIRILSYAPVVANDVFYRSDKMETIKKYIKRLKAIIFARSYCSYIPSQDAI